MGGEPARWCSGRAGPGLCLAVALGACGRGDGRGDLGDDGAALCVGDERLPIRADGLTPQQSYDYLAIRLVPRVQTTSGTERWELREFLTLSEVGSACATATSEACRERIEFHPAPSVETSCGQSCVEWSIVTTQANEVRRWVEGDILELLGSIDSADDALMRVLSKGYSLDCPSSVGRYPRAVRPEVRAVDDGFEVTAMHYVNSCPFVIREYRLHVSPDGAIEELDSRDYPWDVCA